MYTIDETVYGIRLSFSGQITPEELESWISESEEILKNRKSDFGVFVDLRNIKPIHASELFLFRNGQKLYKNHGMVRSSVILKGAIITLQFRDIAKKSDIFFNERYIDASSNHNWEEEGIKWVKDGIEPSE